MSGDERVGLEFSPDGIATISLQHPPLNIYDLEMRDQLIEAITAVRDVPSVNALVLRAEGRHFSAGADLSEFGSASSILEGRRIRWDRDPWLPLLGLPVPTVASLHGFTVGSGLEMSLLCDIRVAAPDTVLGLPETKLGMLPAAGGTQSLTRAIGPHAALPIVVTARNLDAEEALERGIVWEICDEPDVRAQRLAQQLAGLGREITGAARRLLHAAYDLPLESGLQMERRLAQTGIR